MAEERSELEGALDELMKALAGNGKDRARKCSFSQKHVPGRLSQSDFTHMTSLGITMGEATDEGAAGAGYESRTDASLGYENGEAEGRGSGNHGPQRK